MDSGFAPFSAVEVPGPKIDVGKLAMAIAPLAAHIDISCWLSVL